VARELTATDKPMCHIPAGKDWSDDEIVQLRILMAGFTPETGIRRIISEIKAKCEANT
jgi:hypothetical protein